MTWRAASEGSKLGRLSLRRLRRQVRAERAVCEARLLGCTVRATQVAAAPRWWRESVPSAQGPVLVLCDTCFQRIRASRLGARR